MFSVPKIWLWSEQQAFQELWMGQILPLITHTQSVFFSQRANTEADVLSSPCFSMGAWLATLDPLYSCFKLRVSLQAELSTLVIDLMYVPYKWRIIIKCQLNAPSLLAKYLPTSEHRGHALLAWPGIEWVVFPALILIYSQVPQPWLLF